MPYTVLDKTTAETAPVVTLGDPLLVDNGMSFADIDAELNSRLLSRTDITPARRLLFINQAYLDLCTSLRLDDLKASMPLTLVEDQPLYLLPDAVASIQFAAISETVATSGTEGRPLEKIDLSTYRGRRVEEGLAREWFRHTGMFVIWPTPDYTASSIMSIDFRIRPAFVAIGDIATSWPILQSEWHEAIILLAKQKILHEVKEFEASQLAQNEYVNYVRRRTNYETEDEVKQPGRSSVPTHASQTRWPRKPISPRGF